MAVSRKETAMNIEFYIREQMNKHPSMQMQDIVKLCYQAAKGPEHIVEDINFARNYLLRELEETPAAAGELYEAISDDFVRINLAAWKFNKLPDEWLLKMFVSSAAHRADGDEKLEEYLNAAGELFDDSAWAEYAAQYRAKGKPAVHHSEAYREAEKPAYRVLSRRYARLLPLLAALAGKEEPCVIVIDGRAASGKSTTAALLSGLLGCDVVHMDDFFLPPALRTAQRLAEPGGNVHYERFIEEVLPNIRAFKDFAYRIFDCSVMNYDGERHIKCGKYLIVEGAYSLHPLFGDYADIKVFSDVSGEVQLERIRQRDGEEMLRMFKSRWIPYEESYVNQFGVENKADIII